MASSEAGREQISAEQIPRGQRTTLSLPEWKLIKVTDTEESVANRIPPTAWLSKAPGSPQETGQAGGPSAGSRTRAPPSSPSSAVLSYKMLLWGEECRHCVTLLLGGPMQGPPRQIANQALRGVDQPVPRGL